MTIAISMTCSELMLFILTSLFFATLAKCTEQALAIKDGIDNFDDSIPIGANSYMDLVKNSKVFVDNSLLIKKIDYYRAQRALLILGPNKWGKSINLDMIRTFYDENYEDNETRDRLFTKGEIVLDDGRVQKLNNSLLITSEYPDFVRDNMGKLTVIYVNFRNVTGENLEVVEDQISSAFKKEYERHGVDFYYGQERTLDNLFLQLSMQDKSKNILIIVEDYDKPILNFLINDNCEETQRLFKLLRKLIPITISKVGGVYMNLAKEVQISGIFATGNFQLEYDDEFLLYYIEIYFNEQQDRNSIGKYFGFTEENVRQLFHLHKIDKKLSTQALKWYRYQIGQDAFYNPISIAKFLKEKTIASYCKEDANKQLIQNAIQMNPKTIHSLLSLISNNSVSVDSRERLILEFDYQPIPSIGQIFCDVNKMKCVPKIPNEKRFLTYLWQDGYLSMVDSNGTFAKLANSEMASEISQHIISYYKKKRQIDKKLLKKVSTAFIGLIEEESNKGITFQQTLTALYKSSHINEAKYKYSIRSILNCVLLKMQHELKLEMVVYYNKILGPDYVTVNEETGKGAIIQLCHNSSVEKESEWAEQYVNVFQNFTSINQKKLIVINISPERKATVFTKIITE